MSTEPTMQERLDRLAEEKARVSVGGGQDKIEKQHERGKLTARERINALVDEDTFQETGMFATHRTTHFGMDKADAPADGVVTGSGAIFGRPAHIASQDFTVMGGSAGETQSNKVAAMMQASAHTGTPFIFINDSGGARVQEGIDSLSGYGKVFYNNVLLSGLVPQISIIAGPCAGGAAYSPALTDFIIQTRNARELVDGITSAGSVFLGDWSPESAGDYASGTNHVLPTYGYTATCSSLGLADFQKRMTVQELSKEGFSTLASTIETLAAAERLTAHKNAVTLRVNALKEQA